MSTLEITPFIPAKDGPLELEELDVLFSGEVGVVEDAELDLGNEPPSVVEMLGQESRLYIHAQCARPYLVLHFKALRRFFFLDILCIDSHGRPHELRLSNKTSFVTVDKNTCSLPLQAAPDGWQYAMIDLEDLMANAFSRHYHHCEMVSISGSLRISKLFFQSRQYADIELPSYLRVVRTQDV